jgi:hypothetical protein
LSPTPVTFVIGDTAPKRVVLLFRVGANCDLYTCRAALTKFEVQNDCTSVSALLSIKIVVAFYADAFGGG